jgi:hypothetical protein
MKIGYSVEGSTDRAVVHGLRDRWCARAELVEGRLRGSSETSRRREIGKTCSEFKFKDVDAMIFLTDANQREWREVQREERARLPSDCQHRSMVGIPDRNIECWLCAEPGWLGKRLGVNPDLLRVDDPKGIFNSTLGISRDDKQETTIAEIVKAAPLWSWLNNTSFEDFYQQVWQQSKQHGCTIENLRESKPE